MNRRGFLASLLAAAAAPILPRIATPAAAASAPIATPVFAQWTLTTTAAAMNPTTLLIYYAEL